MMNCLDVRSLLLEAEPEELTGEGATPLAEHVRTCGACGALAGRILEETAALDGFLAQAGSGPNVDAILAGERQAKVIPFPAWRRWTAVAAAAAVSGLFFLRGDAPMQVADTNIFEEVPLVEAAPDQNVAVLATANPDITVLWFF